MLIVICGSTATGKSDLAIKLAQSLNTVIISADSRLVYRDFNIGTAKPTKSEQDLITHFLIDICDPTETLTVADYQDQANHIINSFPNSRPLLMVGGTGLYIKSVVKGMKIPRVAPQIDLRSQLILLGQKQLYSMLTQVDPFAASKIHFNDQVRTLRALEVYYVTGKPISLQQGENPPSYPIIQIGLDCDVKELDQRIIKRTEQMLINGWLDEVKFLLDKYGKDLPLMQTLGYAEMSQYLLGEISLETAKELTILHTRQFAKRQRTWFRSVSEINWFNSNDSDLLNQVKKSI
ncbi:MAG TPA: tRNA (adenosine(37)-N6)-dimethylallyltransferase MiaA [Allocoleopsis sp.]